MTDLEKRALMGDKKAQEECTEKGIVLSCPCCGGQAKISNLIVRDTGGPYIISVAECRACGTSASTNATYRSSSCNNVRDVISAWNTRVPPNFWPCGVCEYGQVNKDGSFHCPYFRDLTVDINPGTDCCCKYKPREKS